MTPLLLTIVLGTLLACAIAWPVAWLAIAVASWRRSEPRPVVLLATLLLLVPLCMFVGGLLGGALL